MRDRTGTSRRLDTIMACNVQGGRSYCYQAAFESRRGALNPQNDHILDSYAGHVCLERITHNNRVGCHSLKKSYDDYRAVVLRPDNTGRRAISARNQILAAVERKGSG